MDEDDEFGDLYAGLGGASEQAESTPAVYSSANARFEEEEEEEDDLYSGFPNAAPNRSVTPAVAPPGPPAAAELSEDGHAQGNADGSDSDSEDDLQIVLNNDHKRAAAAAAATAEAETTEAAEDMEGGGGGGGGAAVAAANAPAAQSWPVDDHQPSLSEAPGLLPSPSPMGLGLPPGLLPSDQVAKPGLPVAAAPPRPAGRPFVHHAQFKYVRGPMAGGPMMNSNPGVLGRGTFQPGAWKGPPQGSARPWSGPPGFGHNEFHLPPTKTVFDTDLDALEDKPWRHPNADITDYFNFGFNEVTWRMYCQQLSQLRLESTMQTKISVYESGRGDQPIGRAIQVEGGVGERRPSFDARRNRNRDSNEVIEIVLVEAEVENHYIGNDYDGTSYEDAEPSSRGRNGPFMDGEGPFFPMGPRPRAPYRMFPGGPFGPGRGTRPPFYEPGMPPLPMHMRPDGGGDLGDPSRSRANKISSQGRGGEEEHSSGSMAVKDDRKYADDRRSKGSREQEDDEKSDEHNKTHSQDKYDRRHKRYSDASSRSSKDVRKESASDAERSSHSDAEDQRSKSRSRKDAGEEDPPGDKKTPDKDRGQERLDWKDDDWPRKSYREREGKEEDTRRSRGGNDDSSKRRDEDRRRDDDGSRRRDEDSSRRRDEESSRRRDEDSSKRRDEDSSKRRDEDSSRKRDDDGRKRDKAEEPWQRKDREDSYSHKRRSGYDDYERRDRDDERDRSKRHGYDEQRDEEDYLRRKSKHDSHYRDSRQYDDDYYDHRKSSSSRREHSAERQKDEERKDKYYSSSRSKDGRNGSTSEYADDRKKRKTGEYQKSVHAEKVRDHDEDLSSEKKSRKPSSKSETAYRDDSYSSEGDEDGSRRKGRSKMERLNRERPPEDESRYSSRHEQVPEKRSSSSAAADLKAKPNGDRQEFLESVARRKERFMKMDSGSERKASGEKDKVSSQLDEASEFKHERPARKRRWGS